MDRVCPAGGRGRAAVRRPTSSTGTPQAQPPHPAGAPNFEHPRSSPVNGTSGQAAGAGADTTDTGGPTSASPRHVCSEPGCPHLAVHRGLCATHRQSTTRRGYGAPHQAERAAALPGASCEACGCTRHLQRDHRDPTLQGPMREEPANKRWLCACTEHACHQRLGLRRDGRGGQALMGKAPVTERDLMVVIG